MILKNIIEETIIEDSEIKKYLLNMKNYVYFNYLIKKNKIELLKKIIKWIKIEKFEQDQVVFYEGEDSTCLYFILKGGVNIFVKNKNYSKFEDKYDKDFYYKFHNNEYIFDKNGKFMLNKVEEYNLDGSILGEKGLMNYEKRSATVITNNFTNEIILAKITKEEFNEYLLNIERQRLKKKIGFFKSIFKKNEIREYDIIKISEYFKKIKLKKNEYLFRKNENFDKIFIIYDGNLVLENKIKINFLEFYKNIQNIENNDYIKYKKMKFKNNLKQPLNDIINKYNVRVYRKGDFHGLNEFMIKSKTNLFSGRCASDNLSIYYITIKNFIKIYKEIYYLRIFIKKLNDYLNFTNIYKNEKIIMENVKSYYKLNAINNFFVKIYLSNNYDDKIDIIDELIKNKNFDKMRSLILVYLKKSYQIYQKIKAKKYNNINNKIINMSENKKPKKDKLKLKNKNIIDNKIKHQLRVRKNIYQNYTFLDLDLIKKNKIDIKKKLKDNKSLIIQNKIVDKSFKIKYIKNKNNSNKIIRISKLNNQNRRLNNLSNYYNSNHIKKKTKFSVYKKELINKTSILF